MGPYRQRPGGDFLLHARTPTTPRPPILVGSVRARRTEELPVSTNAIEILRVEDDPDDACLTIRALRKHKLAENVELVTDGAQALDFLFSKGDYVAREANSPAPKVVFLDLKLPKV